MLLKHDGSQSTLGRTLSVGSVDHSLYRERRPDCTVRQTVTSVGRKLPPILRSTMTRPQPA